MRVQVTPSSEKQKGAYVPEKGESKIQRGVGWRGGRRKWKLRTWGVDRQVTRVDKSPRELV